MPRQLILASNNPKKLHELQALLSPLGVQLVTQGSLGIPEAEEPHVTFVENALAKARHAAHMWQVQGQGHGPTIADDSGLCVDALAGAPGVRSARYAVDAGRVAEGLPRADIDAANNAWLLDQMAAHTNPALRGAHFSCLLVAVRHAEDPEPLIAEGHWRGELLHTAAGVHGFGYDPLLWLPEQAQSAAQMAPDLKNRLSHRAQACAVMCQLMSARWGAHPRASDKWPWQPA